MPLDVLRDEIFRKTAPLKSSSIKNVSRIFFVLLSQSISHLEEWFQEWFPIMDEDLKKIYQWIMLGDSSENISEIAPKAWLEAFDAGTTSNLTAKGYRIMDTANQLIFVGDLTEDNSAENLEKIFKSFNDTLQPLKTSTIPLYKIGIFLIRSIDEELNIKTITNFKTFSEWAQGNLDRTFLIDISNQYETVVSNTDDLHFLILQLLYALTRKPIEFDTQGNPNGFGEWVNNNSSYNNLCTGFSGISILTPVDQILETALVKKGAEVLNEVFFGGSLTDKTDLYLKSLLNKTGLNSYETISALLRHNSDYPLIDPFLDRDNSLAVWNINKPENFIKYSSELNENLPQFAASNENVMTDIGKKLIEEFRYNLIEYINTAISKERGGVRIATEFLENLRNHVKEIIPKEPPPSQYPEPSPMIDSLAEEVRKGPRMESFITRTFLLGGVTVIGTISSKEFFDIPSIFFPVGTVVAVGGSLLYWYSWKNRVENLVIKIQNTLKNKWDILMQRSLSKVIKELHPYYISAIDEMTSRVSKASLRLEKLVKYYRDEYECPKPKESPFWVYAIDEEFGKYSELIDTDISKIAFDYLINERPLELWDRVSPLESPDFNLWECQLLEKAALRLMPYSERILGLSVCKVLTDFPEKLDNHAELISRFSAPFLTVKEGQQQGEVSVVFEISEDGCQNVDNKISGVIRGQVQNIQLSDPMTSYRISLFSFLDGMEFNSLGGINPDSGKKGGV